MSLLSREEYLKRIRFITQFARAMQHVGSPAHTVEAALLALSQRLGLKGTFIAIPSTVFCSFRFLDEDITRIARVEVRGIQLGKLADVDSAVKKVVNQESTFEQGTEDLEQIFSHTYEYSPFVTLVCFLLTSMGMLTLFGGTWADFLVSGIVGLVIGIMSLPKYFGRDHQLHEALIALVATVMAYLFTHISPDVNEGIVIISGMIMFLPGLNITLALSEIATQNLVSGTSRLMGGVMVLLKLTFGVFIGKKIAQMIKLPDFHLPFNELPNWIIYISLPITSAMSTVIFKAKKSDLKWITLAGIYGYISAKVGTHYFGPEMGMFIGGVMVGAGSNIFARFLGRPSSIFQFPGIILLVPGSTGYRSLSFLLDRRVLVGFDTAITMVALAFSLVVGVFVGNILIKPRQSY